MSEASESDVSVLVVEDEILLALMIEQMIEDSGARVWASAKSVSEALALLLEGQPDVAVLDVNLGEERVFPVCERLAELAVPFLFSTGYGEAGVPREWRDRPILQKPYGTPMLTAALNSILVS